MLAHFMSRLSAGIALLLFALIAITLPQPLRAQAGVATTTTLTGPGAAYLGEALRFDVQVRGVSGTARPQGTISLRVGNAEFHAEQLDSSGNYRLPQFAGLPAGVHQVRAHFIGGPDFAASVSDPITVRVAAPLAYQSRTVIEGPTAGAVNMPLTFRIRATANQSLNGVYLLLLNGFSISVAQIGPDGWGSVTGVIPSGDHLVQGVYLPTTATNFRYGMGWSVSEPLRVQVTGGPATIATRTVLQGPAQAIQGQALRYSAMVTERAGGAPASGGRVHFLLNGSFFESVDLDAAGSAVLNIPDLPLGRYQVVARYMGSPSHTTSGSDDAPIWLEVGFGQGLAASATTLNANRAEITEGESVTFEARVSGQNGIVPQGWVSFRRGGAEIGRVALNAAGRAQFTSEGLQPFSARMTAHFLGSAGHGPSTSAQLTIPVNPRPVATTTTLTGPTASPVGVAIRFTARVTAEDGRRLTGRVFFRLNGEIIADLSLLDGVAQLTRSNLPEGHHVLTAQFQGSNILLTSESQPLHVTIGNPLPAGDSFIGGGTVFGQTAECGPGMGAAPQAVAVRYSPSELGGLPSGVTIAWPEGSEALALWGPMTPSAVFQGAAGRQSWTRFVFYPTRPLIRVVQREVIEPAGAGLDRAVELLLRLRVQLFAATPGCTVTLTAILRRDG